jgi:Tripartite tricarboxylate transporter family receptor
MIFVPALAAALVTTCALVTGAASAQTYPDRPVTMIVAFPPGGADDATARILQDPMQRALGHPIGIENVGGAGGMIAAAKAARAKPGGYTILLHQDALPAGMTLYPDHRFDAEKDAQVQQLPARRRPRRGTVGRANSPVPIIGLPMEVHHCQHNDFRLE